MPEVTNWLFGGSTYATGSSCLGRGNAKVQIKGLVIFYEDCTHQPNVAGVIQNDGACHSQVVAMDGINDSGKGQNYPQEGGTVIGVTASGKNNINSGIIAPRQWHLDPGVTLKSGATAATIKVAKLAKDKGIYYMSYGASAPHMEISNRAVSVTASVKTYKITYQLNGRTNNKANPATYDGTKAIKLINETKAGYTFAGWYTDSRLTKKITTISIGTKINYLLYGKWTKKK